jgi:hypothetical protein
MRRASEGVEEGAHRVQRVFVLEGAGRQLEHAALEGMSLCRGEMPYGRALYPAPERKPVPPAASPCSDNRETPPYVRKIKAFS